MKTLLLLLPLMGTCSVLTSSVAISNGSDTITSSVSSPLPPEPPPPSVERPQMVAFKPSTAVIVGLLTAIFSITFLALLYVRHCKTRYVYDANSSRVPPLSSARKNSGVNRAVIESLPVFRFGSLRGEKEGLECAVCLNRFEPNEVLRLLPKCKHAFHVECVDTWLEAHSTCPLCRYRVDPEDVLLCGSATAFSCQNEQPPPAFPPHCEENQRLESVRRVSGRHSSAGERGNGGGLLQIVLNRHGDSSANNQNSGENNDNPLISRRSLDSWNTRKKTKKKNEVSVGCFDRQPRKDGLLLTSEDVRPSSERRRRLEHRIIISEVGGSGEGGFGGVGATVTRFNQRWSDVQPPDLLYLHSEMIMSNSRRLSGSSSGSRPSVSGGRSVINERSVSEMTGVRRFGNNQWQRRHLERWQKRAGVEGGGEGEGVLSRWMVRTSQNRHHHQSEYATPHTRTLPFVRSGSTVA